METLIKVSWIMESFDRRIISNFWYCLLLCELWSFILWLFSGSGFQMEYGELDYGCGGHVYLRDQVDPNLAVQIKPPNFPGTPPPHTECIWIVMAPAGKEVQFGNLNFSSIRVNQF